MAFHPFERMDDTHTFSGGLSTTSDLFNQSLTLMSQKLVSYINLKESNIATIDVPFVWLNNHIDLTETLDFETFGTLHFFGLSDLRAIGSNTALISYDLFVNIIDPMVTMPTAQLLLQAPAETDEYATGPISKPLSQVSSVLKAASNISIIKPYALAASSITQGAGRLASLLGFSKPTVIDHPKFIVQNTTTHMANTDMNDPAEKLTLTAKQETTVDPRVTGCPPIDEMRLATILERESCLGWFEYKATDARHSTIFECDVTPVLGVTTHDAVNDYDSMALTSMAYGSLPFQYWSGDITFRFMVLGSKFHNGRIYLTWEPARNTLDSQLTKNYTKVIDIGTEQNVSVTIPWGSPQIYKEMDDPKSVTWRSSTATYDPRSISTTNGTIRMKVMNKLTVGQLTPSDQVRVMVFVKACPNFTLQAPNGDHLKHISLFEYPSNVLSILYNTIMKFKCCNGSDCDCEVVEQSPGESDPSVTVGDADCCDDMTGSSTGDVSKRSIIHFGEEILSIKSLLLRTQFFINENAPLSNLSTGSGQGQILAYFTSNFPRYFGFDPNGNYEVTVGSVHNFNPTKTTLLNYFTPGYVCRRGGIKHYYVSGYERGDILTAVRKPYKDTWPGLNIGNKDASYYFKDGIPGHTATEGGYHFDDNLISGGAVSSTAVRNSLNVKLPYYSPTRFFIARNLDMWNGNPLDFSFRDYHCVFVDNVSDPNYGNTNYLKHYVSAADDFSLSYYIGAPALFYVNDTYAITGP